MRVSQLLKVMDKDDEIVIDDFGKPIDKMMIYNGAVRGIKRDDPINKMHIYSVNAYDYTIIVLAGYPTNN
jgi:hypothetical protein